LLASLCRRRSTSPLAKQTPGPAEQIVPEPAGEQPVFLSTVPARRSDRRLALAVILVALLIFLATAPFARTPLLPVWAFVPAYESALAINDLIIAVLLFAQYSTALSPALLVLASCYLFSALMAVLHGLTFPGVFSSTGLLDAQGQTSAWLYMFWHAGFPIGLITYARLAVRRCTVRAVGGRAGYAILASSVAVIGLVAGLTMLATIGAATLPRIMQGNTFTVVQDGVGMTVWTLSILAAIVLWLRRPHTVLDLWLIVVMCAWTFDVGLSAVLNTGRFDLGFYVGRTFGLVAASFVLIMLLLEAGALYARLARSQEAERRGQALHLQEVETARDAAIRADRAKSRFLATASHDLRQPLHAMNLFISALRRRVSGDEATKLVEGMASATESMQGMFNSLLDVSKLDAGAVQPSFADIPIDQLLVRLRAAFAGSAAAKGLALDIPEAAVVVHSDPVLLESVLRNLVSNAIRYTRKGAVTVRCDAREDVVDIEVRDTGPGIPADQHETIFEEFRRLETPAATERGLGLGLAIVRRLAGLLAIDVTVQSELGHGSTFRVQVPRARWDDVLVGAPPATPVSLAGRRLLLVDDDPLVRAALGAEIADWGAETIVAGSADEVLAAVAVPGRAPPEVAIVDRDLAGPLSGPALMDALKQRSGLYIPAVIVTGATDPDALDELRRSGYPWITKPIDVGVLRGIVDELLPARRD